MAFSAAAQDDSRMEEEAKGTPMNGHGDERRKGNGAERECTDLANQLSSIQNKRRKLKRLLENESRAYIDQWLRRKQDAERERQVSLGEYQAAVTSMNHQRRWLDLAGQWNVTNDCFHIWHRGPFGTINGLRLASEVPTIKSESVVDNAATMPSETTGYQPSLVGSLGVAVEKDNENNSTSQPSSIPETLRVPWVEINSALGLVVLLLSTLEKKPYSGIKYQNKLVPQGSTSKVGVRKGETVTFYNLFSDDSFQLFGRRSFNIALNGLLRCLVDARETVEEIDRTISLPYPVETVSGGLYTIGGLSVAFGAEGDQWTRAMKYLLTDVKWLVAFTTKHVDR